MIRLTLPFPPSVNRYWRHVGRRILISREGRQFRERVCSALARQRLNPLIGDLSVAIDLHPPDRRRRDADNFFKAALDALEHAGVYEDDAQITHLEIHKRSLVRGGKAVVSIEPHHEYVARESRTFELVCCAGCGRDVYRQIRDPADAYCERCISHEATHAFPEEIDRRSDLPDDFDPRDEDEDEDDWDDE